MQNRMLVDTTLFSDGEVEMTIHLHRANLMLAGRPGGTGGAGTHFAMDFSFPTPASPRPQARSGPPPSPRLRHLRGPSRRRAGFLLDLRGNDFADELGLEEADLDVKVLGPVKYCGTSG